MAKHYSEKNADLKFLKGKKIVILGYGSQGHGQALNLRDSGLNVTVSVRKGGRGYNLALKHGWQEGKNLFTNNKEAVKGADWVHFLLPDETQKEVWENDVLPNFKKGAVMGFSHGFNIRYNQIVPPKEADVILVAPKGPGHLVRRTYEEGKGTPALVAIEQNYSKKALQLALAYCKGIGATRAGVIETTFSEETETDNFGEQCVLCGGVVDLIKAGFETLVEAGYQPEIAYFECLHELKLITDLIQEGGISWMNYSISDTAEYGEYSRGPRLVNEKTKEEMRKILGEIRSGQFAKEYLLENKVGRPVFNSSRKNLENHPIEKVGAELRAMMPWLKKKE
ncbi:MAG: ketol-acid reductoisomerase [Elusimicrobia bacterium RIFCSPLOWO2_02_FULL_39_32]|nr:MAG: ketol-acid reductoisomerase [Elusimicrobia bacterium GWA2_38_7]OGR79039.1 MAG: ketol-acid reductoisomerase [Elusimicrobia bacterium RIFCSPHIGHO2_02_FULL_39_36]OGR92623.1 MAG: ketol-acid reductoisomerase [Elusimicrobia bacterium RIFCSPLOWO2_02_FULL_39_32]OGR99269.1 MAG: ketol-acid reductoisomerase [Elusimicrobia bacterium RIFCSPLOWO2_12_FULL_39_28]